MGGICSSKITIRIKSNGPDLDKRRFFTFGSDKKPSIELTVSLNKGSLIFSTNSQTIHSVQEDTLKKIDSAIIPATIDDLNNIEVTERLRLEIGDLIRQLLKRGLSTEEIQDSIQKALDIRLGRRKFLEIVRGVRDLFWYRSIIKDALLQLIAKPFVLMPKLVLGILEVGDASLFDFDERIVMIDFYSINLVGGGRIVAYQTHNKSADEGVYIESVSGENIQYILRAFGNPQHRLEISESGITLYISQITPEILYALEIKKVPHTIIQSIQTKLQ